MRGAGQTASERFNGRFRDESLNEHWFISMRHTKRLIEERRIEYDTERTHRSLGYLTPVRFARTHDAKQQFLTSDSNCSSGRNPGASHAPDSAATFAVS